MTGDVDRRAYSFVYIYIVLPHQGPFLVGSQSRETSLEIFQTPVNRGYEVSGGYFPFPSVHPGADKVHDGASGPREPYAAAPATKIRHPIPYSVGVQPAAPAAAPTCCSKASPNERGKAPDRLHHDQCLLDLTGVLTWQLGLHVALRWRSIREFNVFVFDVTRLTRLIQPYSARLLCQLPRNGHLQLKCC